MLHHPRKVVLSILILASSTVVAAQSTATTKEALFRDTVYPVLQAAQCASCHNDNGVASATGIEFPNRAASPEQITAFGLKLREFVDRNDPNQSPLLRKPTNRDEHTGGVRIVPGSDEESKLTEWVYYLAKMPDDEWASAQVLIERANRWDLEPLTVRRLTHSQYNNTVRDLLADQSQPANNFPKEDFIHGFKNQLEGQGISPLQAEAYGEAAERFARSAFRGGDPRNLLPLKPTSATDRVAAESFVRQFGGRAYRRPLSPTEFDKFVRMHLQAANQTNDFYSGAKLVVETMLQSPHFLFRIERHYKDSDSQASHQLAQFQLASRLSYLLWDTMPNDAMLEAAAHSKYSSPDQIETLARKMMDDSRAVAALDEFLAQWMRFDRVVGATRDRRRYRDFNAELTGDMVEETRRLFRHLVWGDRNFMQFFSADYTFVSSSLAQHYALPAPPEEFAQVSYPAYSGRSGVLGHGSFLVSTSKPAETSPTSRGLFIRNQFLAQEIAPPPPGINSVLPEIAEDKPMTNRQRLNLHLNSEACSGCHRLIDPIGLGFEQYDAVGRFHTKMSLVFGSRENILTKELDVDTNAHIQGIRNSEFARPRELGKLLAENETCQRCIVKQYFRYAFGREETSADQLIIEHAYRRFRDSDFRFRELIMAFISSKLFLQREHN